jgi:SRSO17 transposase
VTAEQVVGLQPAFGAFLERFRGSFRRKDTFRHLLTYCRGLMSMGRKSVEPIALAGGTAVRTLQQFLATAKWDHWGIRDRIQREVAARSVGDAELGAIGVIDETSDDKKGDKTPGVERQWLGRLGKTDNGIVTVHLAYVCGRFKTLIDADLFLPKVWGQDRPRCKAAGIPDSVRHRPKTEMALEQVRRARANGVQFDWLTYDEGYGKAPWFLLALDDLGQRYVGEVPKTFHCATARQGAETCEAQNLLRHSPQFRRQSWKVVRLQRQTLAPQTWRIKAAQVYFKQADDTLTERSYWLIVGWQPETGEHKFWISNAPPETVLLTIVKVAFTHWNVEHSFRVAKSEIGFSHYEGRCYNGLLRHLMLCTLVMFFVAEQTAAQAAFFPGDYSGTDGQGAQCLVPSLA